MTDRAPGVPPMMETALRRTTAPQISRLTPTPRRPARPQSNAAPHADTAPHPPHDAPHPHPHDAPHPDAPHSTPHPPPHEPRAPRHPRAACATTARAQGELAQRFAQRLVEVLAGVRPLGQLVRHTTHDGYRELARLSRGNPLRRPGGALPRLGPVHESAPGPGALEVCVRVEAGPRHHVVAFRLERHRRTDQWQCATVGTW
ncbi:Rv3235 family protein [Kitasatospora sp. NPDC058965]|uniref:Rv3235 family protein n=1 Tax=Kitasatospora sp. NPDC058965 TaxID=3346682 RepID=UPI00369658AE